MIGQDLQVVHRAPASAVVAEIKGDVFHRKPSLGEGTVFHILGTCQAGKVISRKVDLDKFPGHGIYEAMSITVASVLNAKGKRSEVAKLLGKSKQTVNCWVTKGSIPAKFSWILSDPPGSVGLNLYNPEYRKVFGLLE